MKNTACFLGPLVAIVALTGCAADTTAEPTAEATSASEQDLVGWNLCSAGSFNGWPLNVIVELDRANPHYIWLTFVGVPYTIQNNAHVRLVHPNGTWVQFETADSIVDRVRTHAYLNWSSASGVVTSAVGPGDVFRITPVFDLPHASDKGCSTFLAW
jgi:hypothetical protein